MEDSIGGATARKPKPASSQAHWSTEHYVRIILHRKWLVLSTFLVVTAATAIFTYRLPDIYTSETVILVDPQKVPEAYVKATVSGDIRGRLGTLSQQILSATRLQKIIDTLKLYPEERKTMAREDVITRMRADISVNVVSDFGGSQSLQAFRIRYNGKDARLVAQVTNELAALFIEENLKAREQQATGTTDFLQNQLRETRKSLDEQEAKLRDFKLKHIGEMPEQEASDLQILGQLQSQLQLESDALSRAEQQRSYIQSMMAVQSAPVMDLDPVEQETSAPARQLSAPESRLSILKARLALLLTKYSEFHPDVQRLKRQIADEQEKQAKEEPTATEASNSVPKPVPVRPAPQPTQVNPVLQSQLEAIDAEIAKHKEEQARLSKLVAGYHSKLQAIPVREQEITALVRDYEISKAHYKNLLENQLSAETATQLEIRQKGERFTVLDPAQPAQRPSKPKRVLLNLAGSIGGLVLGLGLAIGTELLGNSITTAEQISATTGLVVFEVVPFIQTRSERTLLRKRMLLSAAGGTLLATLAVVAFLIYRYRSLVF
jgi:polysaccharide chain length determinant protein (PEP-CTERM system associated)